MNGKNSNMTKILCAIAAVILVGMTQYLPDTHVETASTYSASQPPESATQKTPSLTRIDDLESFWAMIQLGGGIGYLTIGVFALGLFLALVKFFELFNDGRFTKRLEVIEFGRVPYEEIPSRIQPGSNSWLGRLLLSLLNIYRISGSTENAQDEITNFMQYVQDRFESFRGRMAFLSDSAGALGLLGTVWGMFLTFFGGNLSDSEKILNGMGVALVTTLIGLVVSLILNFSTTEISSIFYHRLDVMTQKSDELRLRLMELEKQQISDMMNVADPFARPRRLEPRNAEHPVKKEEPKPEPPPQPVLRVSGKLPERMAAGTFLPQVLRVLVFSKEGKPLPNEKVNFSVIQGHGAFGHFGTNHTTVTNVDGEILADFAAGSVPEVCEIRIAVLRDENQKWQSRIEITPAKPARLRIESGNDQTGPAGETLAEPLVLVVTDHFDNPVQGTKVRMRVALGDGALDGKGAEVARATGVDGRVAIKYRLGPAPGFNTVMAQVEGVDRPPVEFRALAKAPLERVQAQT